MGGCCTQFASAKPGFGLEVSYQGNIVRKSCALLLLLYQTHRFAGAGIHGTIFWGVSDGVYESCTLKRLAFSAFMLYLL